MSVRVAKHRTTLEVSRRQRHQDERTTHAEPQGLHNFRHVPSGRLQRFVVRLIEL